MNKIFQIPKSSEKYIFLQRSEVDKQNIAKSFTSQMKEDFDQVLPFLPDKKDIKTILDIGCGIGGVDVFMAKYFENADIHLLDKTMTEEKVWYGFRNNGAFYNSLEEAKKFIIINGISENRIFTHTVSDNIGHRITLENPSIVTSFKSWGFHYPVAEYIPDLINVIKGPCSLIIDIRHRHISNGISELSKIFNHIEPIYKDKKHTRYLARDPKCN